MRLLLVVVTMFISGISNAIEWSSSVTNPTVYGSADAVCSAAIATYPASYNMVLTSITVNTASQSGSCKTTNGQIGITYTGTCSGGSPPGSDGFCPNTCTATAGTVSSSGMYDLGVSDSVQPPLTACNGSCELSYSGSGVVARQLIAGQYHYYSQGSYVSTSTQCTGDSTPVSTASLPAPTCDPATQDQGTVNGRFVCLDRTTTKKTTVEPTVTNPDGTSTQKTTTTDSATGTDTTTTTTTAADGTATTTTTTKPTEGTPTGFCQDNPDDPSCSKEDIPWGDIPAKDIIQTHEIPISIDYTVIGGEGQCPADESLTFLGQPLTWSYGPICTFADMIRPLVLILAWLSFAFIIVGGLSRSK